ncbi:carboxymuconolactone decarboxylase family protein [Streptomyces sp. H27-C3]|uniref:carboxymuconolactone decarboxylase family protein n=1 Tax=Streptomyces sp. H27-C3 TaxID=3046305 RepID=UPI0024BAD45C|nr:carboxymuconolactone decarboxylase family protein [Streptomyces sp. H27-C3]MDJ0465891.1 carboxymuconolactone decarboxylase family protein [Streptomyces sp. H27-C3]
MISDSPYTGNDRMRRGLDTLCRIERTERPGILDGFSDVAPDLGELVVAFAFGDICSRPGLDLPTRQLVTVAALTALGNAAPQLEFHVRGARNVGCTRQEIVETVTHVCLYAGFPATINALTVVKTVFEAEPEPGGITGPTEAVVPDDRRERGLRVLKAVDGDADEQVIESLQGIAPDLARYLIEFAFGDISSRGGIDLRTREIVTVAACTALGTARPQLKVHVNGLLNVGGTEQEAVETIMQMIVYAGVPAAVNGLNAAREVFRAR